MIRYRFSEFTLSPQRRLLVRDGREVPLIPRYFDLLVLLIERRHEAVHRREIFERVWTDANVSDSALSQAIRILRRTLDDDSREPRFIRTVSRHGYRFVLPDVIEEEDDGAQPAPAPDSTASLAEMSVDEESASVPHFPSSPVPHFPSSPVPQFPSGASGGGALAGITAGALGGLLLTAAPGSNATIAIAPVLAVIGGVCGALGGAGVGLGLFLAESHPVSPRTPVLIAAAALGGGVAGTLVQWLTRWGLTVLVGIDLEVGGGLEGVAIGGAAGVAYALAGEQPLRFSIVIAVLCGLAGVGLALAGHPLVGGTIHAIADAAEGSRATLAPLGRLIGEPDLGPVSRAILAFGEAATFGLGLAYGLRRRPPR